MLVLVLVVVVFDVDVVFVVFAFGAVFVAVVEECGGGGDDVFGVLFDAFEVFVGVAAFIVFVGFGALKTLMSSSSESFSCFSRF